ncbi:MULTISPECIES: hypothetical protein, partial [Acinetobacter]|uniref:hypothetical protein n=1 Tax=Acinetobacter TaxID=469 RepID=UPI000EE34840
TVLIWIDVTHIDCSFAYYGVLQRHTKPVLCSQVQLRVFSRSLNIRVDGGALNGKLHLLDNLFRVWVLGC